MKWWNLKGALPIVCEPQLTEVTERRETKISPQPCKKLIKSDIEPQLTLVFA